MSYDPDLSLMENCALNPDLLEILAPSDAEKKLLLFNFDFLARPKQFFPEGDWYTWLIKSGRGFGKTWVGSQWIIHRAKTQKYPLAIIGKNAADVRDVQVEVGDSSILKLSPPWFKPEYQPSKRRLIWPNGVIGILYSAEDPDLLRGPQHSSAWLDEFAKYQYPKEVWDNLLFGLRLGDPKSLITTTPRPIKQLIKIADHKRTIITSGSTYENKGNLAPIFLKEIEAAYGGTRLGRQELLGELLLDNPGALWTIDVLEANTILAQPSDLEIWIAIDPAVTSNERSNETGIIVVGKKEETAFVLADLSGIYSPNEWAKVVLDAFKKYDADGVVAEVNQGGDLVESNLMAYARSIGFDRPIPYKGVRATKGKYLRAQPVSTLYEQGKVKHIGSLPELEDQLLTWIPGDESPDRLDALVWGITHLLVRPDIIQTSSESLW